MSHQPIGVFDSGIGGISVLHYLRQQLPNENLLYVADSAYAPYGRRELSDIQTRCAHISEFLIEQGAKAIVVACNTATAAAIELLREQLDIPIIGMEPGLKPALTQTKTNVVAVLATDNTLTSERFHSLNKRFNTNTKLIVQPCTNLVTLIENEDLNSDKIEENLAGIIPELLAQGVDTIVLGCSHYPLIRHQIEKQTRDKAIVIDTGSAIAKETLRRLSEAGQLNQSQHMGNTVFWTSDDSPISEQRIVKVWPDAQVINKLKFTQTCEQV